LSLKTKAINGIFWNIINSGLRYPIAFVIGIILARLLEPKDFGIIAMIAIVTQVSSLLIDSGFNTALIRKKNVNQVDLSTVFIFNFLVSLVLYFGIYIIAPYVAIFYQEPIVVNVLRVAALGLVLSALGSIHRTILNKEIDFKLQTIISILSVIVSGAIGVTLAMYGYGVWSLVYSALAANAVMTTMLWIFHKWKPTLVFSISSFKELFKFGSNLLLSSLLNVLFSNLYYVLIGKFYTTAELGYFNKAQNLKNLPSKALMSVVQQVSFPVLSRLQDSDEQLHHGYKVVLKSTMFVTSISLVLLASTADTFIIIIIGQKWFQSIIYLQLLCFIGVIYPLQALNVNILLVKNRTDLFLKIEILKKILIIGALITGYIFGIIEMIIVMIINSIISFFINSYYSGKLIKYNSFTQLKDIGSVLMISLMIGFLTFVLGQYILSFTNLLFTFFLQVTFYVVMIYLVLLITNNQDYKMIKNTILDIYLKKKNSFYE
jgi:teichuronic acid exporter